MAPSTKTLSTAFPELRSDQVKEIRRLMLRCEAGELPIARGRLAPGVMDIIDGILETHGVEYIQQGRNSKSPSILYCNTGDSYGTTILYVNGRFRVGSWADIVERGNYE